MEPQEKNCFGERKEPKKRNCLEIIANILFPLFIGVIGIIIGSYIAETITAALSAVIVLAIVLGILLILTLILIFCNRNKDKKCEYKCCR